VTNVRIDVTAAIVAVRTELTAEIGAVRTDLTAAIGAVRTELTAEIGANPAAAFPNTPLWIVSPVTSVPIPAPFPYIACHIVKP